MRPDPAATSGRPGAEADAREVADRVDGRPGGRPHACTHLGVAVRRGGVERVAREVGQRAGAAGCRSAIRSGPARGRHGTGWAKPKVMVGPLAGRPIASPVSSGAAGRRHRSGRPLRRSGPRVIRSAATVGAFSRGRRGWARGAVVVERREVQPVLGGCRDPGLVLPAERRRRPRAAVDGSPLGGGRSAGCRRRPRRQRHRHRRGPARTCAVRTPPPRSAGTACSRDAFTAFAAARPRPEVLVGERTRRRRALRVEELLQVGVTNRSLTVRANCGFFCSMIGSRPRPTQRRRRSPGVPTGRCATRSPPRP